MIFHSENRYRNFSFRVALVVFGVAVVIVFILAWKSLDLPRRDPLPQPTTVKSDKTLVLTFDDGPDPDYTPAIQEILKKENVPAVFFFTGQNMLKYPELVKETHKNGFLIGNHSFSHSARAQKSPERMAWELRTTNRILEQQIGYGTRLYRAPFLLNYEKFPDEIIDGSSVNENHPVRWAHNEGFINVGAFVDGYDYDAHTYEEIVSDIESTLEGGNIILLHDGGGERAATVKALPLIIHLLRAQGYQFVAMSDFLGIEDSALMPMAADPPWFEWASFEIAGSLMLFWQQALVSLIWFVLVLSLARIFIIVFCRCIPKRFTLKPWAQGVTVLVPAFNEEANIEATIRSVFASRHELLEVIVIDDGSTDNTVVVVEKLANEYPGLLHLISKHNGGKASALNFGIGAAKYSVVVAVDADTVLRPDAISYVTAHFNDPSVGAVAGTVKAIHSKNLIELFQVIEYTVGQFIEKQAFNRVWGSVGVVPGAIGAWRLDDLLAVGGYSEHTLAEDQDLTLAFHSLGKKVVYESRSIAYTEVPKTFRGFVRQRRRWVFGSIQCLWKYRHMFFSWQRPQLGIVILPFNLIFATGVTLLAPIVDFILIYQLFTGIDSTLLSMALAFMLFDLVYVGVCLCFERASLSMLLAVPLQRVFYRFTVGYILFDGLVKAVEGRRALWGRSVRFGSARQFFTSMSRT